MTTLDSTDVVGHISYTVSGDITREMVDDYLVSAFEGGINYWCEKVEVKDGDYRGGEFASDVISRDGTLYIHLFEPIRASTDGVIYPLTLSAMLYGIQRACHHYMKSPVELYDFHDADVADVIVQYALFGEVVFG